MCDHVWIFEARTLSTQPVRDQAPQMWQAAYRHPTSTMREKAEDDKWQDGGDRSQAKGARGSTQRSVNE